MRVEISRSAALMSGAQAWSVVELLTRRCGRKWAEDAVDGGHGRGRDGVVGSVFVALGDWRDFGGTRLRCGWEADGKDLGGWRVVGCVVCVGSLRTARFLGRAEGDVFGAGGGVLVYSESELGWVDL